jgi:hypothetical protein
VVVSHFIFVLAAGLQNPAIIEVNQCQQEGSYAILRSLRRSGIEIVPFGEMTTENLLHTRP